jgi:ABC-type transport system substrate-binding protein
MISQYYTGGSRNYGKFSDANLDAVLDKAQAELNAANRDKIMDEFQTRFVNEWMPMYVLCAQPRRVGVPSDIGGYDTSAGTWYGYGSLTKVCRWFYIDK